MFHVLAKRYTPPKLPGLEGSRYRLRRAWAGVTCFLLETITKHRDHPRLVLDIFSQSVETNKTVYHSFVTIGGKLPNDRD